MKTYVYANKATRVAHNATKRNDACRAAEIAPHNRESIKGEDLNEAIGIAITKGYRRCLKCLRA